MPEHLRMDVAGAQDAMSRLSAAGERMTTAWRAASSELDGLASGLGAGELGAAFLAGYQQPAADTRKIADQYCELPARFAETGRQGIANVQTLDTEGGNAISR